MENLVIFIKCVKWVHGGCAENKKMTSKLTKDFVGKRCVEKIKNIVKTDDKISFFNQIEFVKTFCYLGDVL